MGEIGEREINLKHLFFSLCKKWRQIFICALIVATVLGLYCYQKGKIIVQAINEKDLALKENQLEKMLDYLNKSVVMRNSNAEFWRHDLQFDIIVKNNNSGKIMKLFESYSNAICAEDIYNIIANELGEKPDYIYQLYNLIDVEEAQKKYIIRDDSSGNIILSFCISLIEPDAKYSSKIVNVIKAYIEKQKVAISSSVCPHDIEIINIQTKKDFTDFNIERTNIEKSIKNLKAEIAIMKSNSNKNSNSKKWILIGFMLGAFGAAGVFIMRYIFSDNLHESEEIESIFGIKTWNTKRLQDKKIKEILIATFSTKKDDYNAVLATGVAVSDNLKNIVVAVNKEIGEDVFLIFEDVINNPNAIKALSKTKAVLLLETVEKSKMTDIYREIKDIKQSNIPIIGCIVD